MNKLSNMNKLINELSDKPFEYGVNDCFTFTAKLVKEWHGKDYLQLHINQYSDEESANEYINRYGANGLDMLTTGTLGYGCDPERCKDGDVVIAEVGDNQVALGFVFNKKGLFKTEKRVGQVPLKKCIKGWRL